MNIDLFNEDQKQQLRMAEDAGVDDSVCAKHPEWPPTLMNVAWNREAKDDGLEAVHELAAWLGANFPKNDGVLCDDVQVILYGLHAIEKGRRPIIPERDEDGAIDVGRFVFQTCEDRVLSDGGFRLWSGRVSLNDVNWMDAVDLMAEGDPDAKRIISRMQSRSVIKETPAGTQRELPAGDERSFALYNILLALDDMNLRGYQIPYALEYAGGSTELLYQAVHGDRANQLCDYVNKRSAQDLLAGNAAHNQIAVSYGASFCYDKYRYLRENPTLVMAPETASSYAGHPVQPRTPDWSKLDIIGEIAEDEGLRIIEARGFRLIRRNKKMNNDDPDASSLLFYNPETKDYIHAKSSRKHNICYGGVYLYMRRDFKDDNRTSAVHWSCSMGANRDQPGVWIEITQNQGLFRYFEQSKLLLPEKDFDWRKIGFGTFGLPVPTYFEMPRLRPGSPGENILGPALAYAMNDMGGYYFASLLNRILCLYDTKLQSSTSPHYKLVKDWFRDGGLFDVVGHGYNAYAHAVCAGVFEYLQMPDAEQKALFPRTLEGRKFLKEVWTEHAGSGRNIVEAYGLPDPAELPVPLPWLRDASNA